jgi:hypothetical protein
MSYAGGSEYVPGSDSMTSAQNYLYGSPTTYNKNPFTGENMGVDQQGTTGALYNQQRTNFQQSPMTYGGSNGQNVTPYTAQSYTPQMANYADNSNSVYGGMLNAANEASKAGAQSGMDMMSSSLGQRGLGNTGGMAQMGQGNIAATLSGQMANNQRQNSMNQLGLQQQQQTQNQNAYNQAAQYNTGAQNQGGMFNTQNQMGLGQYNQNAWLQGQQLSANQQQQQLQNMLSMYLGQLPSASTVQPGWGSALMGGITGAGTAAGGLAKLV